MHTITCTSTDVHGIQGSERFLVCTHGLNPLATTFIISRPKESKVAVKLYWLKKQLINSKYSSTLLISTVNIFLTLSNNIQFSY